MRKVSKSILVLLLVILSFTQNINVNAAGEKAVPITVTASKFTDKDNVVIENGATVSQYRELRMHIDFKIPHEGANEAKANDFTIIKLPNELRFESSFSFDLNDPVTGLKAATAYIDKESKEVKIVYTDFVETHSDISLSVFFGAVIDTKVVKENKPLTIEYDVQGEIIKGGDVNFKFRGDNVEEQFTKYYSFANNEGSEIRYTLRVNTVGKNFNDVTVYDELRTEGISYDKSSFKIEKGTYALDDQSIWQFTAQEDVTAQYTIKYADDDKSFSVHFGQLTESDRFKITYKVLTGHDSVAGEEYKNYASMKDNDNIIVDIEVIAKYQSGGGEAEGYNFTVNLEKVDENDNTIKLEGAEFDVIRQRSNVVVGTLKTDVNGKASISGLLRDTYIIRETKAPNGYELLTEDLEIKPADFDASNKIALVQATNKQKLININGVKSWNDGNNQDGIRPEKITVILKADGIEKESKEVKETDNWEYSFTNLPMVNNGKEITYTVEEVAVPGYDPVITGYDIENKHTPATIEVKGTKTWNDGNNQDGIRPEKITVILKADGTEVKRLDVTEADGWNYVFTNLPVNKDGNEITYTVEEVAVPGYDPVVTGYDIENKHTPATIEVRGTKTWNDGNNQDGIRPEKITVILKADGTEVKRLDVTEADGWNYVFTNLPVNKDGKEITYTVEEVAVPGYEPVITGYDIENKHTPATVEVRGVKTWNDGNNQDGIRPDKITVILKADGTEVKRLDVTEADGWNYVFTNLPVNKDGKEITYTVEEVAVPGYETVITGYNIDNRHVPGSVEISGSKTWNDGNNQDGLRPDKITVILMADGVEVQRLEVTEADQWKYTFTNLPKLKNGKEIIYTVEEVAVPGYETIISGLDIENVHTPSVVGIEGIKTWVDNNNAEGRRPDSITVRLWADGIEIINAKPIWTKSGNEWKYTFVDMPEYQDGKRIVYSVSEDSVTGYETKITNLDIENTLIPQLPSTGQSNNYLGYLLMLLGVMLVAISRKKPEEISGR